MTATAALAPGAALDVPDAIETPALVVDLDRVRANLDDMAQWAAARGVALHPHVKTHRTIEFARMQVEHGAGGICVAKLSEAEVFIDAGLTDVVMAYPIVGEDKHRRAIRLAGRARLRLTTDSREGLRSLAASFDRAGATADVLIEIDTGMHRTGASPDDALGLAREAADLAGVRLQGIITHEGHAAGADSPEAIRAGAIAAGQAMVDVATGIRSAGIGLDTVSVGSTATAKAITTVAGITEVRPGIYAFNDYGQVMGGSVGIERCAARVVATVVSRAAPDRAVVDAGSKSLGQDLLGIWYREAGPGHGLVVGHPGWQLFSLSEEHGWLRWEGSGAPTPLPIGTRVQILPNHICSAFHVLGRSFIVERGRHVATWTAAARGCSQ